jgi:subtilisin family serine protease
MFLNSIIFNSMKINFLHVKLSVFLLFLLASFPTLAQRNITGQFYDYSSIGRQKTVYRLSYSNIFVKFQPNTTDAEITSILRSAGLKAEDGEYSQNPATNRDGYVRPALIGVNKPEVVKEILTKLEANPKVVAANPFIVWNGEKTEANQMGITDEFYVKLKPNTTLDELRALVAVSNTRIKQQYPYNASTYILIADKASNGNALEMANLFFESTKFEYAAVDFHMRPTYEGYNPKPIDIKGVKDIQGTQATVNDPLWPWQYSHRITPTGIPGGQYPASVRQARTPFPGDPAPVASDMAWNTDASMRVDEAWDIATTAGLGVKVAIIDNGVERNHPDLVANMSPTGFDPADPTNLGDAGTVEGHHGTNCAGVVAAVANNGIGVSGVAHRATIVPIQIFTTNNAGLASAVDWSWQVGNADVSSNSYGFPGANTNPAFDIPVVTDAFNRALTFGRGGKGQVIIASAGNADLPISGYPGRIPGIISSIASNAGATRAGFSQFGGGADIAAPGNQILTTDRRDIAPNQGFTGGEYCLIDGTSFSCPNTAGVAALVLGIGPNLTRQEVRAFIEGTGRKVAGGGPYICGAEPNGSWGQQLGYGIVDAYEACRQAASRINNPVCVQQFYAAPVSSFDDGSFSDNYRKGQNCLYTISIPATSRISASFSSFALAAGDVLEVYDNSAGTGLPIRRFTSVNPGANLSVATGAMTFRFITLPNSPTAAGWSVCYRADDRPEGDFTVNVTSGCVGNAFTFTPTVAPQSTVNEFRWDFGAGAVPQTASRTTPTPVTVTYTTAGAKTVTLTLVGPAGNTVVTKANLVTVSPSFATPINEGFLVPGTPANWEATATGNPGWLTQSGNPVLARGGGFAESQRAVAFLCFLDPWPAGATGFFATPPLNMVAMNTPHVVFDLAHQAFGSLTASQDRLQVQVSTDCGTTWTTVYNKQSVDANPNLSLATVPGLTGAEFRPQNANQWRREVVPIPTAANRDAVRVRFVGISDFGNNIFVDNINITNVVPPGLVNVFGSANTAPLVANAVSGTQINLTWSDNSASETGYMVQRTTTPGNAGSYATVATLAPNTSSYIDGGLGNNTAYTYRLFALNGSEVSNAAVSGLPIAAPVAGTEAFTLIARTTSLPGAITPGGSLINEPFTGCALPAGWTNVRDAGGATEGWGFGNAAAIPGVMPIYATNSNFNGCYAFFNSDGSNDNTAEDLSLVSPLINATGLNSMNLSFNGVFRGGSGGRIRVDVSADGGTTWTTKYDDAVTGTRAFNPLIALPEISNIATGRIRFRWTGDWSWAVAIDNVAVFNAIPGPSNLVAALALPNTANLTWTDNTAGEVGFDIERSTTSATTGFAVVGTAAANATAFTHTNGVISGPVNWYRVVARMSPTQRTDPSNSASVMTMAAPTNLTVTPTSPNPFGFTLAWVDNTTIESGYVVERSTSAVTGFAVIATLPASATSYNDFTGLVENTRYFYRVAATLNNFNSAYSNVANGVTGLTAPSDASAAGFSPNANIIRWRDNSNGESGFRIDASVIGGSGFYFAGSAPANSTSFVHAGLNPDVRLFYRVSPVGLLGDVAAFSNESVATTFPAAATNLNATPISSSEVRLNWVDNSTTEIGYEIYRSMSATGAFTLLDRVQRNNATTYTDVTAVFGVPNFYQVRAYRDRTLNEFSFMSNTANATPIFPAPVLSVSFVGTDRIGLEWIDNTPDETGVVIERTTRAENINGVLTPLAFDVIGTVGAGVTSFTNTGLSRGTVYYYRVRAIKGTLSSAFSNIVNGTTRIGAPSNVGLNLKGTAGNGLVRLNWTAVADPDVVFEVYYFSETKINTLAATVTTTTAVITGLENGVDHWFRIKAVSKASGLKSDYSNTVELRPSIVLGTDDNLTSQGFEIYPNPTSSEFTLKLSQTTKPVSVTVVSVTGQVVHAQKFNEFGGSETISLGAISSGVYVVRVETENGSYQKRLQVVK